MKSRILLGLLLGLFSAIASATTTWQLPAGYYTPAKMPMTVTFPRPDSETNTWARQRIAYADGVMQYRIPIAIQGGAYPFHYQIVSGPSGMTIGQDYGNTNYGIVTWTPAANIAQGTNYPVDVQVTDQDGNTVQVTWSVTVQNSDFIFIDPNSTTNGNNGNGTPGSITNPFNTLAAVMGSPTTVSPYTGKALIFRGGTTPIGGTYTFGTSPSENPAVLLGYTGDIANGNYPTIDMSAGAFKNWGQSDVYFGELHLVNADPNGINPGGETDTIMYFDKAVTNRITFFENTFSNLQWYTGTGSSTNQAAITVWNPGSYRNYFTVIGNTIDNFSVALVDLYATKYGVIDNNKLLSGAASRMGGIWLKSDDNSFSIRGNQSLTHAYNYGAISILMQSQSSSMGNDQIEVCYNTLIDANATPTTLNGERNLVYAVEGGTSASTTRVYVYRNTVVGGIRGYDQGPYTAWLENNIFINSLQSWDITSGTYRVIHASDITQGSATGNLYGTPSDNYIDQNGNLIGSAASQYWGKVGAQIGSNYTPLSAPSWQ